MPLELSSTAADDEEPTRAEAVAAPDAVSIVAEV